MYDIGIKINIHLFFLAFILYSLKVSLHNIFFSSCNLSFMVLTIVPTNIPMIPNNT